MSRRVASQNLVLVGMPGSGKSTVGVLLAKRLGLGFTDTDLLIQQRAGRTLQDIVDGDGYLSLRRIEEQVLLELEAQDHVIATGGSAVYGHDGMISLKQNGIVVFLDIPLEEVKRRIGDYSARGICRHPDQSLEALFEERLALYKRYADHTVKGYGTTPDQLAEQLAMAVRGA